MGTDLLKPLPVYRTEKGRKNRMKGRISRWHTFRRHETQIRSAQKRVARASR